MDDTGEWFSYHPLFESSFLRQRCQWGTGGGTTGDPPIRPRKLDGTGFFPAKLYITCAGGGVRRANAAAIYSNHAWGLFNHSELALLERSLKALPWESLLENPRSCGVVTGTG